MFIILIAGIGRPFDGALPMPAFLILLLSAAAIALILLAAWWIEELIKRKDDIAEDFGFDYDPDQDIFFSKMDAWQRQFGYCELYDESAALLSMIMDCEPIRFEYGGKKWLIELWKGQYGMTTGAEVGVYTTSGPEIELPGVFNGTFYGDTLDEDHLEIAMTLYRNGKALFTRAARHWWLTGFVLGEFSEPEELALGVRIKLKTPEMHAKFVRTMQELGYTGERYDENVEALTVDILYTSPLSPQPVTRTKLTDKITQDRNRALCEAYQNTAGDFGNTPEKLEFIKKNDPQLYNKALSGIHGKRQFASYETISKQMRG